MLPIDGRDELKLPGHMSRFMDGKFPDYMRRLCDFRQMDFEATFDQMLTLLSLEPSRVYISFYYRKQTKNQWARDDPAFMVVEAAFVAVRGWPQLHLWSPILFCRSVMCIASWFVWNCFRFFPFLPAYLPACLPPAKAVIHKLSRFLSHVLWSKNYYSNIQHLITLWLNGFILSVADSSLKKDRMIGISKLSSHTLITLAGSSISLCNCHATPFILGLPMGCAILFDIRMVCCRSCSGVNMQVPTCPYVCLCSYVCLTPLCCYHCQTLNKCSQGNSFRVFGVLVFLLTVPSLLCPVLLFLSFLFFRALPFHSFYFFSSSLLLRFSPIIPSFSLV